MEVSIALCDLKKFDVTKIEQENKYSSKLENELLCPQAKPQVNGGLCRERGKET